MEQIQEQERALQEELERGLSGNQHSSSKSMREILGELFSPTDYVKITNHLPYPVGWLYANPANETVQQTSKETKRVYHGKPDTRILQPGETVAILGGEAYVAINRMFNKYAQRKNQLSAMSNSVAAINEFIRGCYKGKFDPSQALQAIDGATSQKQPVEPVTVMPDDDDDPLGFTPIDEQLDETVEQQTEQPVEQADEPKKNKK